MPWVSLPPSAPWMGRIYWRRRMDHDRPMMPGPWSMKLSSRKKQFLH